MKKYETKIVMVPIENLDLDRDYYVRTHDDWMTQHRYAEAMRTKATFPPLEVVRRADGKYVVLDGWHRVKAYQRVKAVKIECRVWLGVPQSKWIELAAEFNNHHGRPLSVQDRAMVAQKLKNAGYNVKSIGKILSCAQKTISGWLVSRIVEDQAGNIQVAKSATAPAVGTTHEKEAMANQGAIANASVRRILDEMLATLRGCLIDIGDPAQLERCEKIADLFSKLLRKGAKTG